MKKYIINTLIIIIGLSVCSAYAQDRYVYWVHGFGGDMTTWNKAAQAVQTGAKNDDGTSDVTFPSRKIISVSNIHYDETTNFSVANNDLWQLISQFPNHSSDRTKDFIIAHSQGGLVSRGLDKDISNPKSGEERDFGGIVTFGTPHAGAAIINDIGVKLSAFTNSACNDLTQGAYEEAIGGSFLFELFGLRKYTDEIRNAFCSYIGGAVGAIASMKTANLAQHYKVGAPYITGLNGYNTTTPSVAFYGVTDHAGICFKTLYSFTVLDANSVEGNFHAESTDALAISEANNMMNKYQLKYDQWNATYDYHDRLARTYYLDPLLYKAAKDDKVRRDAWYQGVKWLNSADFRWEDVIGAYIGTNTWYRPVLNKSCDCGSFNPTTGGNGTCNISGTINPNNGGSTDPTEDKYNLKGYYKVPDASSTLTPARSSTHRYVQECPQGCTERMWYSYVQITELNIKPSDGVVLAESAKAFPGCTQKILMQGSNHNQMRNDKNTKAGLTALFNGTYGTYFSTPIR